MGRLKYQNGSKGRAGTHGVKGRFYMGRTRGKENYKPGKWGEEKEEREKEEEEGKQKRTANKEEMGTEAGGKRTDKGKVNINPNKEKWHVFPKK